MMRESVIFALKLYSVQKNGRGQRAGIAARRYPVAVCLDVMVLVQIAIWTGQVCNHSFRITGMFLKAILESAMSHSSRPETLSLTANPEDIVNRGHIRSAKPVRS